MSGGRRGPSGAAGSASGCFLARFSEMGWEICGGTSGESGLEVLFYQGRNGGIPPGGGDASQAVGVLIKGESDVFHEGM